MSDKEIELKIKIDNKDRIVEKLLKLGAKLRIKKIQKDMLFNSRYFDFGEFDQALRLRVEKRGKKISGKLTFKGTPKHTSAGHKVRDEFETEVADEKMTRKLLNAVGFDEVAVIEKERERYLLDGLKIDIDELKFGTYVEFEGEEEAIEEVRGKLGLENAEPVKEGYIFIQLEWEKDNL